MDSGASKHKNSHRIVFHTYEAITQCNIHLDDNNIVQAIGMGPIVIKAILEGKINQICIKNVPI